MTDHTELKRLVDRVLTYRRFCGDENHKALADGVRALIAENERLTAELDCPFRLACHSKRLVDQLRAELAGLRTGYEAYERVNAELKAENEALRGAGAGALRFVAFAFDEGVEGAELAGRAIENAIGAKS